MSTRDILKRALKDPSLDGIDYIGPKNYNEIATAIKYLPDGAYISEWRHSLGTVWYEYHVHTNGTRDQLRDLYSKNIRGGNPQLVGLYSKRELEEITEQAQREGHS